MFLRLFSLWFTILGPFALTTAAMAAPAASAFDHEYSDYAALLDEHVVDSRVDYARLKTNRAHLDRVVASLDAVRPSDVQQWSRAEQLAFWINAYNILTLRAIVDHYPARTSWLASPVTDQRLDQRLSAPSWVLSVNTVLARRPRSRPDSRHPSPISTTTGR